MREDAPERRATYERRIEEAARRKAERDRRNAERTKNAAPLPAPPP